MLVEDLMSTDVVTVDSDETLADVAGLLLEHSVGSVIVLGDDDGPIGIVTESDLIRAGYETGLPFADVGVLAVGHRPVVTTEPTATVSLVADRMATEQVKKVPVLEGLDLVGIVTFSDIVWHLSDIRQRAGELASARDQWESEE